MIQVVPLVAIVEGRGEEDAVRILLRRLFETYIPDAYPDIKAIIRRPRQKVVKPAEFESALELASLRLEGGDGIVLVLLDADDDCAKDLAPPLLARAQAAIGHLRSTVVFAVREYEAWLVAAADSLRGHRGVGPLTAAPPNPEDIPSPKAWLEGHMRDGYDPVIHQPALTERMDLTAARAACSSFDKLCRDFERLVRG